MIVYSSSRDQFLADVSNNQIHLRIHAEFMRQLGHSVGSSEIDSWRNSMQFMSHVVSDREIPGDSNVAIEFNIPLSSKRIDFILSGQNEHQNDVAAIIELKQWSQIEATEKDATVRTWLGGRDIETAHPSYQAWTYARLIEDYNETVREVNIRLAPCAYLHNLDSGEVIHDSRYAEHLANAPSFISTEARKLAEFLKQHVKYGDAGDVMYRIEHGRIRPSKSLADALCSMLLGNQEFLMVDDQKMVYETALDLAVQAQQGNRQVLIVEGGPGTGKSVVAVNLLVELTRRALVAQYVSRNAAPRAVYSAKLTGSFKKSHIHNLFKGSGSYTEIPAQTFDALIVDEAHRLNEKSGLYGNLGEHQVKEIISASKFSIFFLDERQRVTLRDIGTRTEIEKWAESIGASTHLMRLRSQFRCSGSDAFLAFIDNALQIRETANQTISPHEYDFRVFDDPNDLHRIVRERNKSANKARVVAGYCWDWQSKKSPDAQDIVLDTYGYSAQWNLTKDGSLWLIADGSINEVGCIHTCQGLEVDYIGVIIGPDFIVRNGVVEADAKQRSSNDQSVRGIRKMYRDEPKRAAALAETIIKNTYRTLLTRGQKGCYVFCTDPQTSAYFKSLIAGNDEDSRARVAYEGLTLEVFNAQEARSRVNVAPIFDLDVAAGVFSEGQLPVDSDWVQLPEHLNAQQGMFVTRVVGESMNRRIPNGAWCLFQGNPGGTRNGKITLVSCQAISDPDTDERYTIKRYFSEKSGDPDIGLENLRVVLKPESTDTDYQPIIIDADQEGDFRVVGEFLAILD